MSIPHKLKLFEIYEPSPFTVHTALHCIYEVIIFVTKPFKT